MELLTYTEAAQLAGLTNKTIQRHVKRGTLLAVDTPIGKRIPRAALAPYLGLQKDRGGQAQAGLAEDTQHPAGTLEANREGMERTTEDSKANLSPSVPLAAHLSAMDLAKTQLDYLQRVAENAQQEVMKEARARMALELQIGQYQRALSEQADSLAEERAGRRAAEEWRLAAEASATAEASSMVVPAVPDRALSDLKTDMPTPKRGWGQRLGRWLLGDKTG